MSDRLTLTKLERVAQPKPNAPKLHIVHFRLKIDPPDVWHIALGPNTDDLISDLRDRYGDRLDGVKVRQ